MKIGLLAVRRRNNLLETSELGLDAAVASCAAKSSLRRYERDESGSRIASGGSHSRVSSFMRKIFSR